MKEEKLVFKGIYGEDRISLIRDLVHIAPIGPTLEKSNFEIKSHIHNNLFQVFLLDEGNVTLLFNENLYEIEAPSYFTIPKNILHGFQANSDVKGWVISLSDFALEKILALDTDVFFEIDEINIGKFEFDNNLLFENLYATMHKLIYEFNNDLPAKHLALEYLVGMMLIRLFRIPIDSKKTLKKLENYSRIYYRRFKQLIKGNCNFEKSLDSYADDLSISLGHLNRICNQIAGQSPRKIVNDYLIQEAKNQLHNMDLKVNDVAFKLGFQDPSYFTRLFKQIEKITPKNYRQRIGML